MFQEQSGGGSAQQASTDQRNFRWIIIVAERGTAFAGTDNWRATNGEQQQNEARKKSCKNARYNHVRFSCLLASFLSLVSWQNIIVSLKQSNCTVTIFYSISFRSLFIFHCSTFCWKKFESFNGCSWNNKKLYLNVQEKVDILDARFRSGFHKFLKTNVERCRCLEILSKKVDLTDFGATFNFYFFWIFSRKKSIILTIIQNSETRYVR